MGSSRLYYQKTNLQMQMDSGNQNNGVSSNPWLEVQPYVETIIAVQGGRMIKMVRGELTEKYARFDSAEIDMQQPAVLFLYIGHLGESMQKLTTLFSTDIDLATADYKTATNSIVINQYKPVKGELVDLPKPVECLVSFSEYAARTLNVTQYLRLDGINLPADAKSNTRKAALLERGIDVNADSHFGKKLTLNLPTTERSKKILENDTVNVALYQECHVQELRWIKK